MNAYQGFLLVVLKYLAIAVCVFGGAFLWLIGSVKIVLALQQSLPGICKSVDLELCANGLLENLSTTAYIPVLVLTGPALLRRFPRLPKLVASAGLVGVGFIHWTIFGGKLLPGQFAIHVLTTTILTLIYWLVANFIWGQVDGQKYA